MLRDISTETVAALKHEFGGCAQDQPFEIRVGKKIYGTGARLGKSNGVMVLDLSDAKAAKPAAPEGNAELEGAGTGDADG